MLNRSTLDVAANLSEVLVDRGIKIVPRKGTLLGELSNSIENAGAVNYSQGFLNLDSVKDHVDWSSRGHETGEGKYRSYAASEHDTYMDNYIDDLSRLVSGYLDFSRNVVNKEVQKLVESTLEAVSNYRHREAEDFFEVEYYKLPEAFTTYTLSEEISHYTSKTDRGLPEPINLKSIADEEGESFENRFLLGDIEEDVFISGWLKSLGGKVKQYILDKIEEYNLQLTDKLNYHLVNYLFYRNLANTTDINTGDSSATLKRKAVFARDYYGMQLHTAIDEYRKQIKLGRVIATNNQLSFSYFNEGTVKLVIYEQSFAELVKSGGSIETLLGYIVTGDSSVSVTVDELMVDGKNYNDLWSKTRALYMVHLNSKRLDIFKHTLRNCFESSISPERLTESELEFSKHSEFQNETIRLGNQFIDQLRITEIEDLEKIALELVARIRFRFSNAYELLSRMRDLMASDSDMEPMEAALYSTVNYLTDYMLDQASIVKG